MITYVILALCCLFLVCFGLRSIVYRIRHGRNPDSGDGAPLPDAIVITLAGMWGVLVLVMMLLHNQA